MSDRFAFGLREVRLAFGLFYSVDRGSGRTTM